MAIKTSKTVPPSRSRRSKREVEQEFENIKRETEAARESASPKSIEVEERHSAEGRQAAAATSMESVAQNERRWLADETLTLLRRSRELDIVRAQDVRLSGVEDPRILEWAASEERIILTHDVATMTAYAYARVVAGESMPGIFEVGRDVSIAVVVEDILLLTECSLASEWEGQVRYLPLR